MRRCILVISMVLLLSMTACVRSSGRDTFSDAESVIVERGPDIQAVQFTPGQVLPPYGVTVAADVATLDLYVSTSQKDAAARLEDIQKAIETITRLAAEDAAIRLGEISVSQVGGSYEREGVSESNVQNLDTPAITLELTIDLAESGYDLLESVAAFNAFLGKIELPDTLEVQALSVETKIGDLEAYRSQIIARVYQELDAVQKEYGDAVTFDIAGLYAPLQMLRLSDTEYYLYLDPVVSVSEF